MNEQKPETRTIGGYEVTTTRLPPMRALKLAPKIIKLMTPLLHLQALAGGGLGNVDTSELTSAIDELVVQLDAKTIDLLCTELLARTSVVMPDAQRGVDRVVELDAPEMIDIAFGDEDGLPRLIGVLKFAGEVNYRKSFFALADQIKAQTEARKAAFAALKATQTPSSVA